MSSPRTTGYVLLMREDGRLVTGSPEVYQSVDETLTYADASDPDLAGVGAVVVRTGDPDLDEEDLDTILRCFENGQPGRVTNYEIARLVETYREIHHRRETDR